MWARIIEIMLGCFLAILSFILQDLPSNLWISDVICAFLMILFGFLSYLPKCRKIHLLSFLVGLYLIALAFFQSTSPPPPHFQAYVVMGILLLMFTLIPSRASVPPKGWSEFYQRQDHD